MIVNSCVFSLYFPSNVNIREEFFKIEKHFTDFQKPFTLVSLPPNAPADIPRVIAITDGGHSRLLIAGNCIQVQINYDSNYNGDVEKCIEYLSQKCSRIVDSVPIVNDGNANFYYSGVTMEIYFDEIDDPISYIKEKFLNYETSMPVAETQFKIATVYDNTFYINIVFQNDSVFKGIPDEKGSFAGLEKIKNRLKVSIDINDRYAFNNTQGYKSDYGKVDRIKEIIKDYANYKLDLFMKEGRLEQ